MESRCGLCRVHHRRAVGWLVGADEVRSVTPDQTALILATADVAFVGGHFAARFYDRLFASAPELRILFGTDLTALKLKFMNTLASLVGSLQHPVIFDSILMHLGRQHRRFGVLPAYYGPVGEALLATLHDILDERWTPDVSAAWAALYAEIAQRMKEGARAG
jgi:hemoglobin-like flavoprotein